MGFRSQFRQLKIPYLHSPCTESDMQFSLTGRICVFFVESPDTRRPPTSSNVEESTGHSKKNKNKKKDGRSWKEFLVLNTEHGDVLLLALHHVYCNTSAIMLSTKTMTKNYNMTSRKCRIEVKSQVVTSCKILTPSSVADIPR